MTTLKIFFLAVTLSLSSTLMTYPTYGLEGRYGSDLEKFLGNCRYPIEDELTVVVRFSLSDRKEIHVHSVKSDNEEVNQFLKDRLEKQKLDGRKWHAGKFYEVPVKLKNRR